MKAVVYYSRGKQKGMSISYIHKRSVMKKEVFVCDNCSTRMRLNSAERHWCDLCTLGSPLEMRPARDKLIFNIMAPLVSPIPARLPDSIQGCWRTSVQETLQSK